MDLSLCRCLFITEDTVCTLHYTEDGLPLLIPERFGKRYNLMGYNLKVDLLKNTDQILYSFGKKKIISKFSDNVSSSGIDCLFYQCEDNSNKFRLVSSSQEVNCSYLYVAPCETLLTY